VNSYSWSTLGHNRYARSPVLGETLQLASGASSGYYGHLQHRVFLESISSRRIWDVLDGARESQILPIFFLTRLGSCSIARASCC
jgi:hypothetical protein